MMRILAAAVGDCIHVIGVRNFLQLAKREGYDTFFLGARVSVDKLVLLRGQTGDRRIGQHHLLFASRDAIAAGPGHGARGHLRDFACGPDRGFWCRKKPRSSRAASSIGYQRRGGRDSHRGAS